MGSYTYNMEVKDIDGKGYDAYKIVEYMLYRLVVFDEFYPFQDQLEDFIEKYYSEMGKFCILSFDNTERTKWYTDDKEMLKLKMSGMTTQEIAGELGMKTHSAVVKRLQKLKKKFETI